MTNSYLILKDSQDAQIQLIVEKGFFSKYRKGETSLADFHFGKKSEGKE